MSGTLEGPAKAINKIPVVPVSVTISILKHTNGHSYSILKIDKVVRTKNELDTCIYSTGTA